MSSRLKSAAIAAALAAYVPLASVGAEPQPVGSAPVKGAHTPEKALKALLTGPPVQARFTSDSTVALEKSKAAPVKSDTEADGAVALETVTVTAKSGYDPSDPRNPDYHRSNTTTATRTDTPIMHIPLSVQVVTQQVLKDQQAFRFQDALKNVSGVQQLFSGGGYDRFLVRGFDLGEFHYRNGVRINRVNFDFANIRQVDVLKGPASVLFGRMLPGGLINAVTKRPMAEPFAYLEQRFGSFDYYRTQGGATGAITTDRSLLYGLDFSYLNADSFREHSFNHRGFVAPSLTWRSRDGTEFNLTVEYLHEDRVYDSGLPALGNRIAPLPITRQFDQPGLFDTHRNMLVDFNWSHQFTDDWKIQSGVVSQYYRAEWNETYSGGLRPDNRSLQRWAWFGQEDLDMTTWYANLFGKFNTFGVRHSAVVGGDHYKQRSVKFATDDDGGIVDIFNPVFPPIDVARFRNLPRTFFEHQQGGWFDDREDSWYGLYFQDQMSLFDDRLHLLAGGRYDWARTDLSVAYFSPLMTQFDDHEFFSPRLGITYQPIKQVSLYGNWVRSFGPPTFEPRTGQPLGPETAEQFEAGLKTAFFDGRLLSTLAAYDLTKTNILMPDPLRPIFRVPLGEARSRGIEWDLLGQLTDSVQLITTYAFTDARITRGAPGEEGNRMPFAPEHQGTLWVKYDFQEALLKGFSVGGGLFAAGKRFGDARNSFFDDAYARVDLFGAYRHQIGTAADGRPHYLTAQLNVNNVTNTEYFILRDRARNLPAEPLTVWSAVRWEY